MPIYEYRCAQCGQLTDALQKMSDPPLRTCPKCGAEALDKVMSRTSFHLKGSGWYVTDYKGGAGAPKSGEASTGGEAAPATPSAPAAAAPKAEATS